MNTETVVSSNNPKKTIVSKNLDNETKKQHDALMDEFKKVHRKMFLNQDPASVPSATNQKKEVDIVSNLSLFIVINIWMVWSITF